MDVPVRTTNNEQSVQLDSSQNRGDGFGVAIKEERLCISGHGSENAPLNHNLCTQRMFPRSASRI